MSIAKTRAFGSSSKSMSSSTVSSFWKEQASETVPGNASRQQRRISCAPIDSTSASEAAGSPPRSTSFSVSPRSPRRSVSSGITSSGGMLPRLTVGPKCLTNQAWRPSSAPRRRCRRGRRSCAISSIEPGAHLAGRRKMPAVPPSRASVITFQAPASSSSLIHCDPLVRREHDLGVLRADLGEDGEVAREVGDQLELALARDVDRPVGDLDVREAELLEPRSCTRRACPARRRPRRTCRRSRRACSRSTSSLRSRFCVTYAVPQPSLTMSM